MLRSLLYAGFCSFLFLGLGACGQKEEETVAVSVPQQKIAQRVEPLVPTFKPKPIEPKVNAPITIKPIGANN